MKTKTTSSLRRLLSSTIVRMLKLSVFLSVIAAALGAEDRVVLDTMSQELQRNFDALKKSRYSALFLAYEITDQKPASSAPPSVCSIPRESHNRYLDVTVRVGDPKHG